MAAFDYMCLFLWIPDVQIPKFPGLRIPRFPGAAGAAGQNLKCQLDPSQMRHDEPGDLTATRWFNLSCRFCCETYLSWDGWALEMIVMR